MVLPHSLFLQDEDAFDPSFQRAHHEQTMRQPTGVSAGMGSMGGMGNMMPQSSNTLWQRTMQGGLGSSIGGLQGGMQQSVPLQSGFSGGVQQFNQGLSGFQGLQNSGMAGMSGMSAGISGAIGGGMPGGIGGGISGGAGNLFSSQQGGFASQQFGGSMGAGGLMQSPGALFDAHTDSLLAAMAANQAQGGGLGDIYQRRPSLSNMGGHTTANALNSMFGQSGMGMGSSQLSQGGLQGGWGSSQNPGSLFPADQSSWSKNQALQLAAANLGGGDYGSGLAEQVMLQSNYMQQQAGAGSQFEGSFFQQRRPSMGGQNTNPLAGAGGRRPSLAPTAGFGPQADMRGPVGGMFNPARMGSVEDSASKPKEKKKRAKTFPEKLMTALMEHASEDSVAWLPDGKSFVIVSPDLFVKNVLNPVFKEAKYASFIRKLHRWGFVRLTSGTGTDCFHHPHFQRNRKDLTAKISCTPRDKSGTTKGSGKNEKPPSLAGVEKFIRAKAAAAEAASQKLPAPGGTVPLPANAVLPLTSKGDSSGDSISRSSPTKHTDTLEAGDGPSLGHYSQDMSKVDDSTEISSLLDQAGPTHSV